MRATTIDPERQMLGEVEMVGQDRWEEIHRRAGAGASIQAIARELDVDCKAESGRFEPSGENRGLTGHRSVRT